MKKYISFNFLLLLIMALILIAIHEFGHYLAYRLFGYKAHFNMSMLIPSVQPNEEITVTRFQGLTIALLGFIFSSLVFVLPCYLFYPQWKALFIGSVAGSIADFFWAFSMIFDKKVHIIPHN